ncbi:chromodomain swi6 [Pyrrhoderma noxium]|uniref:Chromodomain swi6 n=1 Tax=Pyrrhoderma noxium TaxID=2282107 RepID=A0A286UJ77_9AGAM|nr:chromodomain swi6 [Pyrrhoderma noxium]
MFRAHDIFSIWSRKLQPELSLCLLFSQTRSISDMALIRELESDDPMNSTPAKPKSRSSTIQSRTRKETDEARSTDAEGLAGDENEEEKGEDEENEDEEDEEEYEIEAILDAQRGRIKKNEYAYLVKWKGYGEEHNSWVTHSDAGNASELINDYLKRNAKSKSDRQSLSKSMKGKTSASVVSSVSKRGRGRPQRNISEDESEVEQSHVAKRQRNQEMGDEDDNSKYESYKDTPLAKLKSWEKLVKKVNTVENNNDQLIVYFETIDGRYIREPSSICKQRFPLKLIDFYESHLRWKLAEPEEEMDA